MSLKPSWRSDDDERPSLLHKSESSKTFLTREIRYTTSDLPNGHSKVDADGQKNATLAERSVIDLTSETSDSETEKYTRQVSMINTSSARTLAGRHSQEFLSTEQVKPATGGTPQGKAGRTVNKPSKGSRTPTTFLRLFTDSESDSGSDDNSDFASTDHRRDVVSPSQVQSSTPTVRGTCITPTTKGKRPPKTPRQTKKAKEAAQNLHRERYAERIYRELNKTVFGNGLPEEILLKWNNRLLSTAGRATFDR